MKKASKSLFLQTIERKKSLAKDLAKNLILTKFLQPDSQIISSPAMKKAPMKKEMI